MEVKLLPSMTPEESASHAALMCYTSKPPKVGKIINVRERLFQVSHHTTLQHSDTYFTFQINGIAVGDVTFGLHLASPFYNTDQRSGRYAGKMFSSPDFYAMTAYIEKYWTDVDSGSLDAIVNYLEEGIRLYQGHKDEANKIATGFLKEERPYISDKMLKTIAPKVAQEQLRMFIPILFPTGLDFTVNITALVAMYESAWTSPMKDVTAQMAKAVISKYPELGYMFDESRRRKDEWATIIPNKYDIEIAKEPYILRCTISDEFGLRMPREEIMHPVDCLHFYPELMSNSVEDIRFVVSMSVATMGQDQRHRTIRRSQPIFTGGFYLPPILQEMNLANESTELMKYWIEISKNIPKTLAMILAPYGAMVEYIKKGSFNAVLHEQHKRLCWCAQEEIYYLGVLEREAIAKRYGENSVLLSIFQPPCYENGKCAEGARYCGRDLSIRKDGNYFPRRKA